MNEEEMRKLIADVLDKNLFCPCQLEIEDIQRHLVRIDDKVQHMSKGAAERLNWIVSHLRGVTLQ